MKKLFYVVLLLLIAPQIFAGPFDPPPTDQSQRLLGVIFGDSIGNLYLGGAANPVLSSIMEKFNFIMVVVGTIIVSYVAVLSVINTANEGTAMGKKWSAIWIPMRSVAGMALMVPAPASGYSMIQVTVMWIVLQGIGAADTLWNIALDGLANGVSATAGTVSDPRLSPDDGTVKGVVQQVLNASICMQTLYQAATTQENIDNKTWVNLNGQYIKNFSEADAGKPSISGSAGNRVATMSGYSYFGVNNGVIGDKQICGKLRVVGTVKEKVDFAKMGADSSKISDDDMKEYALLIYNTKLKAISSMLSVLNPLADGFADGQYSTPQFSATTGINPTNPIAAPEGYKLAAANAYVLAMQGLVVPLGAIYPDANVQNLQGYTGGVLNGITTTANNAGTILGGIATNQFTTINNNSATVKAVVDTGKKNGWISAGSFYFIFNQTLTSTLFQSAIPLNDPIINDDENNPIPSCGDSNNSSDRSCYNTMFNGSGDASSLTPFRKMQDKQTIYGADLNKLAFNLTNGVKYLKDDKAGVDTALNFPTPGADSGSAGEIIGAFNASGAAVITAMGQLMHSIGGGSNSDPLLAHALFGRYIMLIVEGTFIAIIGIIIAMAVLSAAPFIGGIFAAMTTVLLGVMSWVFPAMAVMWTMGAMLAIYAPLIPYMIFTMGALGWMLVVIEAIVAAPIIAMGVVLPSGDDLSNLHHALTILANIFLRPMLMIFGFLLAGSLYKAVVQLIDFGMADVFKTIAIGTLFSVIVVLFVYVTFIISVTNLCFSLIYAIPDKILRWIGGGVENTNADISEVKGAAQKSAGEVGGGIKDMAGGAGGKGIEAGSAIAKGGRISGPAIGAGKKLMSKLTGKDRSGE
jgi:conjugal transfer/type IV secretion protein DotA/TraY